MGNATMLAAIQLKQLSRVNMGVLYSFKDIVAPADIGPRHDVESYGEET